MNKKSKEKEIILTLRNMNEDILEVFVITRLDKFFKIEPCTKKIQNQKKKFASIASIYFGVLVLVLA